MTAFTLAHLSDPHLPPLPAARLRDFAGKRALGYLNWTRNRHKFHRRDVLDTLVSDMQAQSPDQIAVTGDLMRNSAFVFAHNGVLGYPDGKQIHLPKNWQRQLAAVKDKDVAASQA